MTEPVAWINGTLQPFAQTGVPVWDLGVVAGAAVTEMARTYRHRPFRIEQHIERLTSSLSALGFPQRWSKDQLLEAVEEVVLLNARLVHKEHDLGIVLFSTAGSNATYLSGDNQQATTVVHTFPLPFVLWLPGLQNGVRLQVPGVRQIPSDCFSVTHKVRNRMHWWLADHEAANLEAGSKALLLDHDGYVTETSTSCFYLVRNGRIATANRNVLNSLSSTIVEEIAAKLRIPFERRAIDAAELDSAEEAFLSSTPVGLLPVCSINRRLLPACGSETICGRLLSEWETLTGVNPARQIKSAAQLH